MIMIMLISTYFWPTTCVACMHLCYLRGKSFARVNTTQYHSPIPMKNYTI